MEYNFFADKKAVIIVALILTFMLIVLSVDTYNSFKSDSDYNKGDYLEIGLTCEEDKDKLYYDFENKICRNIDNG